jgi:hypothetical protein
MQRRFAATNATPIFDVVYDQRTRMDQLNNFGADSTLFGLNDRKGVAFSHEPATQMDQLSSDSLSVIGGQVLNRAQQRNLDDVLKGASTLDAQELGQICVIDKKAFRDTVKLNFLRVTPGSRCHDFFVTS